MYRGPPRSKASDSTLCQKCLKRGHYSYECTVAAQQRPYKSRPSRTQQLLNPDLKPKLTTEVPNELLRRNGIVDEILAKKEEERIARPSFSGRRSGQRRSRSMSSCSSESVSTISTNPLSSKSPTPKTHEEKGKPMLCGDGQKLGKRDRHSISSRSDRSESPYEMHASIDRNTRRRMSSFSPPERGRRRSRSLSRRMDLPHENSRYKKDTKQRYSESRSHTESYIGKGSTVKQPASFFPSRSPSLGRMDISDDRYTSHNGAARLGRSPRRPKPLRYHTSGSRSRSPRGSQRVPRSRSPLKSAHRAPLRSPNPFRIQNGTRGRSRSYGVRGHDMAHNSDSLQSDARPQELYSQDGPLASTLQKERSLSPYSKRVVLTRQMQGGR